MSFYVLDENNNKVEAYDKEGVLALLNQAIKDGSLENIVADAAFVTKLKCCVGGGTFQIAFITQAKYNELAANKALLENTYYFIVDDTTADEINAKLDEINTKLKELDTVKLSIVNINDTINNSFPDFRKKSEAKQYIDYFNLDSTCLIYDAQAYQTGAEQPRVDLSSLLLKGKTADDTIGISGRLHIYFNNESDYQIAHFNVLWDNYGFVNEGHLSLIFGNATYTKKYLTHFSMGIDINNKLYIDGFFPNSVFNLSDNKDEYVQKIELHFLNIYYK